MLAVVEKSITLYLVTFSEGRYPFNGTPFIIKLAL